MVVGILTVRYGIMGREEPKMEGNSWKKSNSKMRKNKSIK